MDAPSNGGRDSRFNLNSYDMPILGGGGESASEIYNSNILHNRPTSITSGLSRSSVSLNNSCASTGLPRGMKRTSAEMCYDQNMQNRSMMNVNDCGSDIMEDSYSPSSHQKNSPLSNGKKTKGRVKIKMEYIDNKLRRYTTFSKRKTGIMKKAYELSTLTGTQVMLLVASETGHVYTFATRKLQPMITSESGKNLIQMCLNSPDPCPSGSGDQRMSATGFEETELSYNVGDDEKVRQLVYGGSPHSHLSSSHQLAPHPNPHHQQHMHPHQHATSSPHMLNMSHPHTQSPPSLIPCSSPSPMLASAGGYHQHPSCSSPLPHSMYPPHIPHSHPQR